MLSEKILREQLLVGVDVGSTTTKIVAVDAKVRRLYFLIIGGIMPLRFIACTAL